MVPNSSGGATVLYLPYSSWQSINCIEEVGCHIWAFWTLNQPRSPASWRLRWLCLRLLLYYDCVFGLCCIASSCLQVFNCLMISSISSPLLYCSCRPRRFQNPPLLTCHLLCLTISSTHTIQTYAGICKVKVIVGLGCKAASSMAFPLSRHTLRQHGLSSLSAPICSLSRAQARHRSQPFAACNLCPFLSSSYVHAAAAACSSPGQLHVQSIHI